MTPPHHFVISLLLIHRLVNSFQRTVELANTTLLLLISLSLSNQQKSILTPFQFSIVVVVIVVDFIFPMMFNNKYNVWNEMKFLVLVFFSFLIGLKSKIGIYIFRHIQICKKICCFFVKFLFYLVTQNVNIRNSNRVI